MTEPELTRQVAKMIEAEQRKLMAEMRRRTSLSDQEIHKLLAPFSESAFGAGYKMGWSDAEQTASDTLARAGLYKLAGLVMTAATVAWWMVFGGW